MFSIMVVEDDKSTRKLMEAFLTYNGYCVSCASDGMDALSLLESKHVDLIILDVMMPNMDGYELASHLRASGDDIPILMVSAKQLPSEKRQGFLSGTDDYMTKPVDMDEMLLRVQALLRRSGIAHSRKLIAGKSVLDYDTYTLLHEGVSYSLPKKEFQLLYLLLSYPGRIFTRYQLMDEIWGLESESGDNTVNVHINRLRKRFADIADFELTAVRGVGYKAVINES